MAGSVFRIDGYASLRDYAVIGDGRTAALVARDGSVDWLALPDLHSPPIFAAVLDAFRGGNFCLEPEVAYRVARRYVPATNVLETTFITDSGAVRVTDALTLRDDATLSPTRELLRRLDGVAGTVPMRWRVRPRFGYGGRRPRLSWRSGVPVAVTAGSAAAVCSWDAGAPRLNDGTVSGAFELRQGQRAMLAILFADHEPLILPGREECEARLEHTRTTWSQWTQARNYRGRWREAVLRSALALKLLVYAPSGAVAAAATSSLPECIGGERNWDYRFSWIRDSAFTIPAFLQLGCPAEAHAYFWWLMHASQLTHPRLRVLYRLDGGPVGREREWPLQGYRGSRPVRTGNAAAEQVQSRPAREGGKAVRRAKVAR
ncbi:glycoside hydrolase family 15 protein [Nocardia gipuzkoensis]